MPKITLRSGEHQFVVDAVNGEIRVNDALVAVPRRGHAVADGDRRLVFLDGEVYEFEVQRQGRRRATAHHSSLMAPMPATVVQIAVKPGDTVKKGDPLLVLEAMKMELPVRAPSDGIVTAVSCREGELVQPGIALVEMDEQ